MTIREFLSDRLGKITGQLCCTVAAALFLLATGTSSGVIVLLLLFHEVYVVCNLLARKK